MSPRFILASASTARRRLLQSVGIEAIVQPSYFDEDSIQVRSPGDLVQALAKAKAESVVRDLADLGGPTLVLGCDSVLAIDGEIYGKPADAQAAIDRWRSMRGRVGQLFTGHVLIDYASRRQVVRCGVTAVHFAPVSDGEIDAYVATGEPLNCAGCFALEGKGGLFVEKLEGCHTNVIGLSLPLLRRMLAELGYGVTDFW
jgi:septum formation protein